MDILQTGIKMAKVISITGVLSLIIKIGKWRYDEFKNNNLKNKERRKKLLVTVKEVPVFHVGWEPPLYNPNTFNIELLNPKNYSIQIISLKLMEIKGERIVERIHEIPSEKVFLKSEEKDHFKHSFPIEILQEKNKKWIIRIIDSDDNHHDSDIICFTSD